VSAGAISGMTMTSNSGSITAAGAGTISKLKVKKNNSGKITAKQDPSPGSGALNNISIGSLTPTGTVSAANANNVTITTLGGSIQVANSLSNLSAGTIAGTANLSAGKFGIVTATAQSAAATVKFAEAGVTRSLSVTSHGNGGALPANYAFYYDGTKPGDPNVTLLFNASGNASFDLGVLTDTVNQTRSGFDLAGIYAVGVGPAAVGVHNIVVSGDLVPTAMSLPAALAFFRPLGGPPAGTPGGVQLPQDTVAVAVGGNLPAASIVAKAVPALAAASFAGVPATTAGHSDALVPLATGTGLTQANDTFQVFISGAGPVAQFLVTGPGGSFDAKPMLFADQASGHSPVTATDTLVPSGSSTEVSTVAFHGQGGSLTTAQPINTAITSDGALGDLILSASGGLPANVTAPSILGNIVVTNGGISGTIQTTSGDLGSFTVSNGNITGVTSLQAGGGGLTGKIIVAGNLISAVNIKSGIDGIIAVQGDIGAIQTKNGIAVTVNNALIRFGGITVSTGGVNGQIVAIGNVFGDINITGGLSGRIAVKGHSIPGLDSGRFGILCNVSIGGGIGTTGAIVSAGLLGDTTGGTQLSISGKDQGILAAVGGIAGNIKKLPNVFIGVKAAAVDDIFTNGGVPLAIPGGLALLLQNLADLHVASDGTLSDKPPP
jgi:hypothetical protein